MNKWLFILLLGPSILLGQTPAPVEKRPIRKPPSQSKAVLPKTYSFNVVLEAKHLTVIYGEVTTPVLKINKKMGESFEEGDTLMELDSRVYEENFLKSQAAVDKFTLELAAKKVLYEDDALSKFELEDAFASLASAEADLALAKKLKDATTVRAPYKGKVVKNNMKEFELVQSGKELITLVDDAWLYAKFLAPSSLVSCLKVEMPVDIYIKETGQRFTSTISRIAPVIDPASATIMIEAKLDNQEGKLWAGMTGIVTVTECEKSRKVREESLKRVTGE